MATAAFSTTTGVIRARDFSDNVTDTHRDQWTAGKLRHVIAALAGQPVIITTDNQTGFTLVNVTLVGLRASMSGHVELGIHSRFEDGTETTIYHLAFQLGDTIIPVGESQAKWTAVRSYGDDKSYAVELAQHEHGETEGRAWGKWTAHPLNHGVFVEYEPHTGNPAFADKRGERGHWEYSLEKVARQGRIRQNRMHERYPTRYPKVTV